MDQIESYWESQEDVNVLILTNLDDIGEPYSCSDWGNAGSDSHNLITYDETGESESYDIFNLYNSGAYQSHIFIDHNMQVNYMVFGSISISLANAKINQMLNSCGNDCIASQDNDSDGVSDSDDNCVEIPNPDQENADGDEWSAELSDVQNTEGHDAILRSRITGETVKINYKYTSDKNYIERHIQEHPDIPVIAPKEIQDKVNSPFVSHVDTETVERVTSENYEKLLNQYSNIELATGATAVGVASYAVRLFPFLVAYYRDKITKEELGIAIKKFFPDITSRTINRIGMLTFFGPLYGLFILSSFAMRGTLYGFDEEKPKTETNTKEEPEKKKEGFFEKKFSRRSLFTLSYLKDF